MEGARSDDVVREAIRRAEEDGIIFIDEMDKIAGREKGIGPDVSREFSGSCLRR